MFFKAYLLQVIRNIISGLNHFLRTTIRVHCWGGLGSQLFAICYILELKRLYPLRRVILVAHNGGVTKRFLEVDFLSELKIDIELIEDFIPSRYGKPLEIIKKNFMVNFRDYLKLRIKNILNATRVVVLEPREPSEIRPWTRHVRSHYFHRALEEASVQELMSVVGDRFRDSPFFNAVIHCRLGDLQTLDTKSPLPSSKVKKGIDLATNEFKVEKWCIISDSPQEVASYLEIQDSDSEKFLFFEGDSWQSIFIAAKSSVFVSSCSKLALWGMIFGAYLNASQTWVVPDSIGIELITIFRRTQKNLPRIMTF